MTMRANISELDAMLNDLNQGTYNKSMHTGHTLQANDYFSDFEENTSYSALPTNYGGHDSKWSYMIYDEIIFDNDKIIKMNIERCNDPIFMFYFNI